MNTANITHGEAALLRWQYRHSGGFEQKLFDLICEADTYNLANLRKAFPEEVEAYLNYATTKGYWANLKQRAENSAVRIF